MKNNCKILILQESFSQSGANVICMRHIVKALKDQGVDIDLYVQKREPDEQDEKINERTNIFYLESKFNKIRFKYSAKGKDYLSLKTWQKILNPRLSIMRFLGRDLDGETTTNNLKKLLLKVKAENDKKQYTHILSVCSPLGTIRLAYFIKKMFPDINWTHYMLDPYEYCYLLPAKRINKRKKIFAKYTKNLDKLISTRGIASENERRGYNNGLSKITTEVDLPNLMKHNASVSMKKNTKKNEIDLLYAGAFYKDIRNPEKMLQVFKLLAVSELKFNIYGVACNFLTSNYKNLDSRIILHGCHTHDAIKQFLETSDILVNLGNTIPNQLPSKVFECIATGKPVINFYFEEYDTSLYYFSRYPLAFNLNLNSYSQQDIQDLEKFIHANKRRQISFEEATKNLKETLSDNVVEKIVNTIFREVDK